MTPPGALTAAVRSSSHAPQPAGLPGDLFHLATDTTGANQQNEVNSDDKSVGTSGCGAVPGLVSDQEIVGSDPAADSPATDLDSSGEQDPERGLTHALAGADLTGQGAPTPVGSPGRSSHSTAGSQPAQSQGAARALAEATLVTRAQDGDVTAFERLARSYQGELVRLGYRMLSDLGEAQDAAQDTLLVAWRKLPTVKDPAAFHAWVYQLMTRRCLNLLRRRARRRTTAAADEDIDRAQQAHVVPDTGAGPADQAQVRAMRDGLTAALTTLPAEQRACWVLHNLHHLSYPEIAYAIGVPVSTVRGRVARARAQLTKGMSAWQ